MHIRFADPGDAAACLAVYAQYIDTSITFETVLPSEAEFSGRIRSYGAVYPWLIAEEDGRVLAYAYAHRAQERAAYGWNAELSVYVSRDAAGRGLGTKLYTVLLALLHDGDGSRFAQSLDGHNAAACQQLDTALNNGVAGFARAADSRRRPRAFELHTARCLAPRNVRPAVKTGIGLRMKAPVKWVSILCGALRAHGKAIHRGGRSVIR